MTDDKHSPLSDEVDPSGEHLAADLSDPGDYQVAADETEAEELAPSDDILGEAHAGHDLDRDSEQESGGGDPADVVVDDPAQLTAAESVAARARSSRPVKRTAVAPAATGALVKGGGTKGAGAKGRKPRTAAARPPRTTPSVFVGQSVGELKKVNWPTGDQLRQYFIVVLAFVVLIIAFVGLLDLAFGWALLKLLGGETAPQ